jgi:signal transduction histidine kinase
MADHHLLENPALPVEVRLRAALEVREDPMRHTFDGSNTGRMAPKFAPQSVETPRPLDGAWKFWERLRAWDQRFAIVVDSTVAIGLFIISSGWFSFSRVSHPDLWFVAGLTLPLILRRRAPIAVFMVIALVAFAQWTTTSPLVADSALLVALYTVTAECDWLAVVVAALTLEIGVILATEHWTPVGNYSKSLIFLTGMAAASLFAGVVVRALRSQIDWLAERADRLEFERDQQTFLAAAAERARIAREMHDVVSHNIQVMVTLADAATVAQRSDPQRATEAMHDVSATGRQALGDMRRLLGLLRDGEERADGAAGVGRNAETAAGAGAVAGVDGASGNASGIATTNADAFAPQPGLAELDGLAERVRSTGLTVSLMQSGTPFVLSGAAELTVYRIVQEALTNAMKHADGAHSVTISLAFDSPAVRVLVVDDGRPPSDAGANGTPAVAERRHGGGHGVLGMAERAAAFDGSLVAGPHAEGGWQVAVTLRGCKAPALL